LRVVVSDDDFIYGAAVYGIYDKTDESVDRIPMDFGLEYTTTPGRNFPLPIINYYKEFAPNWTYTLEFLQTNVRRYDSHKMHFKRFDFRQFLWEYQQNIDGMAK
jgi:hypothetical protein